MTGPNAVVVLLEPSQFITSLLEPDTETNNSLAIKPAASFAAEGITRSRNSTEEYSTVSSKPPPRCLLVLWKPRPRRDLVRHQRQPRRGKANTHHRRQRASTIWQRQRTRHMSPALATFSLSSSTIAACTSVAMRLPTGVKVMPDAALLPLAVELTVSVFAASL